MMEDNLEVLQTIRTLIDYMVHKDISSLNKILDKNFTLTHMTGYIQPKEEWLDEISKETMKYYSAKEVNYKINVKGNEAEVIVQHLVDARIWGSKNTWRLEQNMFLEKQNKNWIIVKSIATTF